jgi:acrylyl-CoA reductase (NADPH)
MNTVFKAFVVDKIDDTVTTETRLITMGDLPKGEVLIQVCYSSLNYKDALACEPNGNIIKEYPFVPGIDLAGIVVSSEDNQFQEGDEVLVTGYELGVSHYGGFSQYARVSSKWVVKLPQGLTLKESMIIGTAGFTAALSVHELQQGGIRPEKGPILVTGSTGGVGSISIAILSKLGYELTASTGKEDMKEYLMKLGAARIISRVEINPDKQRTLDKQIWAGVIDCVGGKSLSYIISSTQYEGTIAISGLTGGIELNTNVLPFILRGIRLIGIDSVNTSMVKRKIIWSQLASDLKPLHLDQMYTEISLEQIQDILPAIIKGESRGRVIVKL